MASRNLFSRHRQKKHLRSRYCPGLSRHGGEIWRLGLSFQFWPTMRRYRGMHIPLFDSRLAGRVAAIVSVAFLVGACGSSTPTTQGGATPPGVTATSIKIGTSTPVTGPVGAVCVPINNGAQAVFASVNAKGGINGRKIDSEVLDDAYQADRAVANAKQFINEPVFAVYGGCGSIGAGAIYQPLAAAKVPFVFPTGTLPGLYDPVH